jgi:prolyl-tRNA synthetase
MVTAEAGEDLILASPDGRYAANQERAVSLPEPAVPLEATACSPLATPGSRSIEDLCAGHGFDPTQALKVLLLLARFADAPPLGVLVCLRGDQQLNEVKLANALTARSPDAGALLEIAPLEPHHLAPPVGDGGGAVPFGYLGPHLEDPPLKDGNPLPLLRLADPSAAELGAFVCGANRDGEHLVGARWGDLCPLPEVVDLRSALPGDRCLHDPSQRLEASRGIEVGHIFQLGRKYSRALEARFTTETGSEEPLWMGCYGIGVSRLAQAAVEQHHDADGIRWPVAIAPYTVIIVIASSQDPLQVALGERLYGQLLQAGIDVLLDDRPERAGVKFKDADLIGIPWRLVVGRAAGEGRVELVDRSGGGGKRDLTAEAALAQLLGLAGDHP